MSKSYRSSRTFRRGRCWSRHLPRLSPLRPTFLSPDSSSLQIKLSDSSAQETGTRPLGVVVQNELQERDDNQSWPTLVASFFTCAMRITLEDATVAPAVNQGSLLDVQRRGVEHANLVPREDSNIIRDLKKSLEKDNVNLNKITQDPGHVNAPIVLRNAMQRVRDILWSDWKKTPLPAELVQRATALYDRCLSFLPEGLEKEDAVHAMKLILEDRAKREKASTPGPKPPANLPTSLPTRTPSSPTPTRLPPEELNAIPNSNSSTEEDGSTRRKQKDTSCRQRSETETVKGLQALLLRDPDVANDVRTIMEDSIELQRKM
ncbi:hypothetical protein EV360DRAFT_87575 [Lentinula raphanica]|nr:hypothetical protein EV360DRAFT_87575 [Lentinula raphanica]